MKAKKGKALADELMDDLVDESVDIGSVKEDQANKTTQKLKKPGAGLRSKSKAKSKKYNLEDTNPFDPPADDDLPEIPSKAGSGFDVEEDFSLAELELDASMENVSAPEGFDVSVEMMPELPQADADTNLKTEDIQFGPGKEDDATMKLNHSSIFDDNLKSETVTQKKFQSSDPTATVKAKSASPKKKKRSSSPLSSDRDVRPTVGRFASMRASALSGAEASLAQSENLRIAQQRILELEGEVERLRKESERLGAAGETFRRKADENNAKFEGLEHKYNQDIASLQEEIEVMQQALNKKSREIEELRSESDQLETRLASNMQKIRTRERELENRLELIKMESQALLRNKDEIILELKRQVDQLNIELENYRSKGQDLNKQLKDKKEMLGRTVKALRLALSMLEGGDDEVAAKKKVK